MISVKNPASWWIPSWRLMRRAKRASFLNVSLQTFVHETLKDEQIECIHRIACHGRDVLAVLPTGLGKSAISISPFSLIHDFRKQNARGNVSNISVNHTCYRQIGSKSTNHSPLAWRREGLKVTLTAVISGFRSDLSITRKTSGNSAWFSGDGIADICSDRYFNRPRSIYQYSSMAPRLSGQTSIFGVVFFVSKSLLGIERQKKL